MAKEVLDGINRLNELQSLRNASFASVYSILEKADDIASDFSADKYLELIEILKSALKNKYFIDNLNVVLDRNRWAVDSTSDETYLALRQQFEERCRIIYYIITEISAEPDEFSWLNSMLNNL